MYGVNAYKDTKIAETMVNENTIIEQQGHKNASSFSPLRPLSVVYLPNIPPALVVMEDKRRTKRRHDIPRRVSAAGKIVSILSHP
jgi:hypothetical protein